MRGLTALGYFEENDSYGVEKDDFHGD